MQASVAVRPMAVTRGVSVNRVECAVSLRWKGGAQLRGTAAGLGRGMARVSGCGCCDFRQSLVPQRWPRMAGAGAPPIPPTAPRARAGAKKSVKKRPIKAGGWEWGPGGGSSPKAKTRALGSTTRAAVGSWGEGVVGARRGMLGWSQRLSGLLGCWASPQAAQGSNAA
jgi:hypothetical protein